MLTATSVLSTAFAPTRATGAQKPHIVMLLVDDMGHTNLGYNARKLGDKQLDAEINTPILDKLVDEGIYLAQHYSYAMCAPSRSSLQSGRFGTHVNM